MATLPKATTRVQAAAVAQANGLDTICILAPSPTAADITPRLFGSAQQARAMHGYSEGIEYAALHRQPFLYVALPIDTAGTIGREDKSGNTGTSVTTVTAGAGGVLAEHDGVLKVATGGTIGTDQILLEYSADGGRKFKKYRLGTANSFVVPNFNVNVAFAAGTLVAGDTIHTWHGTAPKSATSDWELARAALAAQQKGFRSMLLIGDLANDTEAAAYRDILNAYETENERFVYGRASVYDRLPLATMSRALVRMSTANVTFAEVGATGDTITRASGSFVTDGFVAGMRIAVSGSASNNFTNALITGATATVLTLDTQDLVAEGPVAGVTITGTPGLTFAEVGGTGDTITRAGGGNFLTDGFRVGDRITVSGTVSNNFSNALLTGVTATVLTLDTQDLVAEGIGSFSVTLTAGQTKAAWMAAVDAEFAPIDDEPRVDLSAGRARITSPFSGWYARRPAGWFASVREYGQDLHITTFRKDTGPTGADLFDENGNLVEWDDFTDGGAGSAARFTTMRTWSNGPAGAFITQSLTRADDDSVLSYTHNAAVTNLACSVIQEVCENFIGRTPQVDAAGHAFPDELATLEQEANAALSLALLTNQRGQGARASFAVWTASRNDVLNVPGATLTGILDLNLRGTIINVDTTVKVQ